MTDQNGAGRSSTTDELLRMLDERGVEWWPSDERWGADVITHWYAGFLKWTAIEGEDGLWLNAGVAGYNSLTPEQAIAATLGRGECRMRLAYEEEDADGFIWPDHYECSACGANVNGIMPSYDTEVPPRFCPNCGRKVVNA